MKIAEIDLKLKHAKQRSNQIVSEIISYVKKLKAQLSELSKKYQEYSNLLHALHPHLRKTMFRNRFEILSRRELEELTRRFEHTETPPEEGGKSRGSSSGRATWALYDKGSAPSPYSLPSFTIMEAQSMERSDQTKLNLTLDSISADQVDGRAEIELKTGLVDIKGINGV